MSGEMLLLARAYAAYDAQDLDALLALLSADVDWPDGAERLRGHDALRRFWRDQWGRLATHDEPVSFDRADERTAVVHVDQTVRDREGRLVSTGRFRHTFRAADGRIVRLDIDGDIDGDIAPADGRARSGTDRPEPVSPRP